MKKYEQQVLVGTILTLMGYLLWTWKGFNALASWTIIIIGKALIFFSILEYVDQKRAFRGENLNKDSAWKKKVRKLRQKRKR